MQETDTAQTDTAQGRFVVFEGLDGSGTTTQAAVLADRLRGAGRRVEVTGEPTTGPFGAVLRQAIERRVVVDRFALATGFAADRSDHLNNPANGIEQALASGSWVLCDRYVMSSLAYQAGDDVPMDAVVALNAGFRIPDLTLFLNADIEVCVERAGWRSSHDELFHDVAALRRVDANYRVAVDRLRDEHPTVVVDANADRDAVAAQVWAAVEPLLV